MKKLAPLNTLVLSVRKLLPVLMGFVLLLLSSTEGWSSDLAHRSGDYTTALRELRPFAEQGDAKAHTLLGFVYSLGEGVIQDYARSHMWFDIAASSGESKQAFKSRDFVEKR